MFLGSWGVETDFPAQKINSSFNLLKDFSLVVPTLPITFAVKTDWPKTRVQIDDKIKEGSAILWQFYCYSCSIKTTEYELGPLMSTKLLLIQKDL